MIHKDIQFLQSLSYKEYVKEFLQQINSDSDIVVDHNYIDYHTNIQWWLWMTRAEYAKKEHQILTVFRDNKDYTIRAWCDVWWYYYWVNQQEENNYIVITVTFIDIKKKFTPDELLSLDLEVMRVINLLL